MLVLVQAKAAKLTVAVFGIDGSQEHETGTRSNITLPGVQEQLLELLAATGTPLVLVLVGGSAMAVPRWKTRAAALVLAGYGGEEAGAGSVLRLVPVGIFLYDKRGTKRELEYARLAMGFANVHAGTRVLMLVLVQAGGRADGAVQPGGTPAVHHARTPPRLPRLGVF